MAVLWLVCYTNRAKFLTRIGAPLRHSFHTHLMVSLYCVTSSCRRVISSGTDLDRYLRMAAAAGHDSDLPGSQPLAPSVPAFRFETLKYLPERRFQQYGPATVCTKIVRVASKWVDRSLRRMWQRPSTENVALKHPSPHAVGRNYP